MTMKEISQKIRHERKIKGLTQKELAKRTGLSRRIVAYYERESDNGFFDKLWKITDALGLPLSEFIQEPKRKKMKHEDVDFSKVDTKTLVRIKQILQFTPQERSAVYKTIDGVIAQKQRHSLKLMEKENHKG